MSVLNFTIRVKQIQNELGTQILADFEEALSVKGVKVSGSFNVSSAFLFPLSNSDSWLIIAHVIDQAG